MGFEKGHKLSPGRALGSKNRRTQMIEEIVERVGVDPFEILMKIAAGDWQGLGYDNECYFSEKPEGEVKLGYTITPEMRLQAAKEASAYLYAKKKEADPIDATRIGDMSLEEKKTLLIKAREQIEKLEIEISETNE